MYRLYNICDPQQPMPFRVLEQADTVADARALSAAFLNLPYYIREVEIYSNFPSAFVERFTRESFQ